MSKTAIALLAGVFAFAPCCAGAAPAAEHLPVVLSTTGSAAFIGKEALESVRLAVKLRNAGGGVGGRMLQLDVQDNASQPSVAIQSLNRLKSKGASAVFGPTFTSVCNAVAPMIRYGPVVSCFSPGVHPKPGSFMFSAGVGSGDMALALARYFHGRGWTRIGLISSIDASGQDFEDHFDNVLAQTENADLHVVARQHFNVNDLSTAAQIVRIKSANPQVVIVWTAGTGLGVVLHAIHDNGLRVPVVAGNGNMVRAQLAQYAGFAPKTLLFPGLLAMTSAQNVPAGVREAQQRYFDAYARAGTKPDLPGALAWDPTLLLLDAYAAQGWDATPGQLRSWIASQRHWTGIDGTYDFVRYPQRGIGVASCVIDRWDPATADFHSVSLPGGAPTPERRYLQSSRAS